MELSWTRFSDREQTSVIVSNGSRADLSILRDDAAKEKHRWLYRVEVFADGKMAVRGGRSPEEAAAKLCAGRAAMIMFAACESAAATVGAHASPERRSLA